MEFALILPALVVMAALLLQFGALAADHVAAQALAGQAARAVSTGAGEAAVASHARSTGRDVRVRITRRRVDGDAAEWVVAEARLRSRAFSAIGLRPEVVARAAARVQ